jgi:hypothetical protein
MSRMPSARALIVLLASLALAALGVESAAGAATRGPTDKKLLERCVVAALGTAGKPARAAAGSADPGLASEITLLRRPRTTTDALPAGKDIGEVLGGAGAQTYDPSATIRVTSSSGDKAVFAVPATLLSVTLPAECKGDPRLAGLGAEVALRNEEVGSGPGLCLLSVEPAPHGLPIAPGPGPTPAPAPLIPAAADCESTLVLDGYVGALGDPLTAGAPDLALIPDGITAITYTFADGHQSTVPVSGNVASITQPAVSGKPRDPTLAHLRRQLDARLPTTVTELGADGAPVATLPRPRTLIADSIASFAFFKKELNAASGSGGASIAKGIDCRRSTHRCTEVVVTTGCNGQHCHIGREIRHYRYTGHKPAAGSPTEGGLLTAPIRGRLNGRLANPKKLTLVLTGPSHRRVGVIVAVSCFSSQGESGSDGTPLLKVAVPSRTPLTIPPHAHRLKACSVNALVTSTKRGAIHARVVRG